MTGNTLVGTKAREAAWRFHNALLAIVGAEGVMALKGRFYAARFRDLEGHKLLADASA